MPAYAVIRSTLAAAVLAGCLAGGTALALPLAGQSPRAVAPEAPVQLAAHQKQHWFWDDGWWRYGQWSDHSVVGTVVTPSWPVGTVWQHWGAERLRACAARYRSFDPATGTYMNHRGERRICR